MRTDKWCDKVKCAYCKKIFLRYKRARRGRKSSWARGVNTITCSKNCSREWNLIKAKELQKKRRLERKKEKNDKRRNM